MSNSSYIGAAGWDCDGRKLLKRKPLKSKIVNAEIIAKEIVGKWGYEEPYWWKPIADALNDYAAQKVAKVKEITVINKSSYSIAMEPQEGKNVIHIVDAD